MSMFDTSGRGICPKCGEDKFIGHGPLCGDCYAEACKPRAHPNTMIGRK